MPDTKIRSILKIAALTVFHVNVVSSHMKEKLTPVLEFEIRIKNCRNIIFKLLLISF